MERCTIVKEKHQFIIKVKNPERDPLKKQEDGKLGSRPCYNCVVIIEDPINDFKQKRVIRIFDIDIITSKLSVIQDDEKLKNILKKIAIEKTKSIIIENVDIPLDSEEINEIIDKLAINLT